MLTKIAKILVFVNVVAAVLLLAWAASLTLNRVDLAQKDPAATKAAEDPYADDTSNVERLQWKVEKLSDAVKAAQTGYARSAATITDTELVRDYRAGQFAVRTGEARTGAFRSFVYVPKSALIDLNQPGQPVKGVDDKPVRGFAAVQQDLRKAITDGTQFLDLSEQRRNSFQVLSTDIDVLDAKIGKQKDILVRLKDEYDYLADRRTDWDEQVRTLTKRKAQIAAAAAALTGK
jgi:outer membrane murein-binding lipoprotein Lpp